MNRYPLLCVTGLTLAMVLAQPALPLPFPARTWGDEPSSPCPATTKPMPGVRVAWEAPPASAGEEIPITLRIEASRPGIPVRLHLEDPAGLLRGEPPRFEGIVPPGEPLTFDLRVRVAPPIEAGTPPRPTPRVTAVLEVDAGGRPYRVQAILVPGGVPVRQVPERIRTPEGESLAQYRASRAGEGPASAPRAPVATGSPALALTGRFLYRDRVFDPNGFLNETTDQDPLLPIRFADVELLENGLVIATGFTDSTGAFDFPVTPAGGETYHARVKSSSAAWGGTDLRIYFSDSNLVLYSLLSDPVVDPVSDTDFGTFVAEPSAGGEPFNLLDTSLEGARQVELLSGSLPAFPLALYWHSNSTVFTGFNRFSLSINLSADDGYDDTVILHEYGHYVTWVYSKDENPGGIHYVDDMTQDPRLSWSEGFASYFQSSVRSRLGDPYPGWYVDTWGTPGAGQLFFSVDAEEPSFNVIGSGSETAVYAALWDIEDGVATPGDGTPGTDDETLEVPALEVWEVITGPMISAVDVTVEDFWDGWFAAGNGFPAGMAETFTAHGMELVPDAFEDDDDAGSAIPIALDGRVHHHTFFPDGDADLSRVDLVAGQTVTLETLNVLGYGDTYLEILDPGLQPVAQSDQGGDLRVIVTYTPAVSGPHTIRVARSFQDPRARFTRYGSYDLRALGDVPHQSTLAPFQAGVDNTGFGAGAAFADFDRDGFLDLYLVNNDGAGGPAGSDVLFRNRGDRTFEDATAGAGLDAADGNIAPAWGDYDNDGDPDLFLAGHGLFENLGESGFQDRTAASGIADLGREFDAAWVDADGSGRLDLFVVNRDGPSALWRNNGDGTFTDVAPGAGFDFPAVGGETYSCAWSDYDQDGFPDLFLARRTSPAHVLYRNLGNNQFDDVTLAAGVASEIPAVGGVWGDANGDGWMDLFVANSGLNLMYLNRGDGTFEERGGDWGIQEFRNSQGAGFADYDLDGDLDLYVANANDANTLYENLGGTMLRTLQAPDNGISLGAAWGDVDNDGDPDLYLTRGCGATCQSNRMYRNFAQESGFKSWLGIALRGQVSNRDGVGCRIRLHGGSLVQTREVGTGMGWGAKGVGPELFGIPSGDVDSVVVLWPSGARTVTEVPLINGVIRIREDGTIPVVPGEPGPPFSLSAPVPNPFFGATSVVFDLPAPAEVVAEIFDLQGRRVRTLARRRFVEGSHHLGWDGTDAQGRKAAPGVYFYRVRAGERTQVRKLVRVGG